jgi:hypothetical protein
MESERRELMDLVKDISMMIPKLDILRLRKSETMISYEDMIESWKAVKRGEDFRETALGKMYRVVK